MDDLNLLLLAVSSNLQTTFDLMQEVGAELRVAGRGLEQSFSGSREGLDAFRRA